jgi:hypothetical protein
MSIPSIIHPSNKTQAHPLKYKYTFADYPKNLFERENIDLFIYFGSSKQEMNVAGIKFDPANLGDALYVPGLAAFLASEARGFIKRPKVFPQARLSVNIKFEISEACEISWQSIDEGLVNFSNVTGEFKEHNVLIIGSGNVNPLTALVQDYYKGQLPLYFNKPTSKAMIVSKLSNKSYSRESEEGRLIGLLLMVPNPWNEQKVAIIAAGTTRWGTQAAILALTNANIPNNEYNKDVPAKIVKAKTEKIGPYEQTTDYDFLE